MTAEYRTELGFKGAAFKILRNYDQDFTDGINEEIMRPVVSNVARK